MKLHSLTRVSLLLLLFLLGFLSSFIIFNQDLILVQVEFEEVQEFFHPDFWIKINSDSWLDLKFGYNTKTKQFYIETHNDDEILNLTLYLFKEGYFMKYPINIPGGPSDMDLNFVNLHTTLTFPNINSTSFYVSLTFWKLV